MRRLALLSVLLALAACGGDRNETEQPPAAAGVPIPSGGLSVSEALANDLDGPLLVRGYVIVRDDEYRLCESILESDPPQCGGRSLRIEGLPRDELETLTDEEEQVSLLGVVDDTTIRVSESST